MPSQNGPQSPSAALFLGEIDDRRQSKRVCHRFFTRIAARAAVCLAIGCITGCERPPPQNANAAPQPADHAAASQPASSQPAAPAILPESAGWATAQCLSRLDAKDETARRSAAVRLVQLSKVDALCTAEPLSDEQARRLRVAKLGEGSWCLGLEAAIERKLTMPVLIDGEGNVSIPVDEAEEEAAAIFVSADPEVFPHVVLTPLRVLIVGEDIIPAIVAKTLGGARFEYRRKDDRWPYLVLSIEKHAPSSAPGSEPAAAALPAPSGDPAAATRPAPSGSPATASAPEDALDEDDPAAVEAEPTEAARFRWDPYESAFIGPAADKLPNPPGGRFEIDIPESKAFIPVGGDIPDAPPPVQQQPPQRRRPDRPPD
ncbi:MAG: hypothetical protein HZB38_10000 [Planctomycetes bacterium]|nr:hypothetical protein [Planctomycetota bacterium]